MIARAVALLVAIVATASAQELHGVVRDARSGQPVPGAIVQLIGAAGNEVSRTLTNATGEYRIRISGAGTVRVLRLGFRPFEQETPVLETTARLDVQLRALATLLEVVRVVDQPGCPRRDDRALALALWEQAKAGLLTSVASRDLLFGDMRVLLFQRWLNPSSEKITDQHVRMHDGAAASSFRSARDAGDFVKNGFVNAGGENSEYHAPDADVLLDERFARGYCFSLAERERGRPQQVGLTFAPLRFSRGVTTVEGTVWIDTAARRLADIKFTYFREGSKTRSGGEISFVELENGLVLIDRWSIRMVNGGAPTTAEVNVRGLSAFESPTSSPQFWTRMNDGGGELARATWPGTFTWHAQLGTLHATVQNKAGAPQAGVALRLSNTDYAATSDSAGIAHIEELLPGPYTVEIEDSTLATIGLPIVTKAKFIAERARTNEMFIRAETAEERVAKMCAEDNVFDQDSYMLIIRVVDKTGEPVSRALIQLPGVEGQTASDGLFVWCKGWKLGARVPVFAWSGRGPATTTSVLFSRKVTALKVVVER